MDGGSQLFCLLGVCVCACLGVAGCAPPAHHALHELCVAVGQLSRSGHAGARSLWSSWIECVCVDAPSASGVAVGNVSVLSAGCEEEGASCNCVVLTFDHDSVFRWR